MYIGGGMYKINKVKLILDERNGIRRVLFIVFKCLIVKGCVV